MSRLSAEKYGVVKSLTEGQRIAISTLYNEKCITVGDPYLAVEETLNEEPYLFMPDDELKLYSDYLSVRLLSKTRVTKNSMLELISGSRHG